MMSTSVIDRQAAERRTYIEEFTARARFVSEGFSIEMVAVDMMPPNYSHSVSSEPTRS
jgi:hypothetical protein